MRRSSGPRLTSAALSTSGQPPTRTEAGGGGGGGEDGGAAVVPAGEGEGELHVVDPAGESGSLGAEVTLEVFVCFGFGQLDEVIEVTGAGLERAPGGDLLAGGG